IVCVSEDELRRGRSMRIRAAYRVIRNGVDLEAFRPAGADDRRAARVRLGLDPDRPLVVCVGRLSRQKGQDVLLEAWSEIERAVPGAGLALVGDGSERRALEDAASGNVMFAGAQPDVRDWLVAADVVAQPSRWEGTSL